MTTSDTPRRVDLPGTLESLSVLNTVGKRIAWARVSKELTQKALGERIGKSRATIVQYEMDNINPPVEVIEKICGVLQVLPEFIAFGRFGVDGVKNSGEMVPVPEIVRGKDAEYTATGHAISRHLLRDFGIDGIKIQVYVLDHDANEFGLPAGSRVIVAPEMREPSRDHDLYLVRGNDGFTVVRIEPSFATKNDELTLTTGNGRSVNVNPSQVDFVGAIVSTIRKN